MMQDLFVQKSNASVVCFFAPRDLHARVYIFCRGRRCAVDSLTGARYARSGAGRSCRFASSWDLRRRGHRTDRRRRRGHWRRRSRVNAFFYPVIVVDGARCVDASRPHVVYATKLLAQALEMHQRIHTVSQHTYTESDVCRYGQD